jgi:radical SAM superfamily enzyme
VHFQLIALNCRFTHSCLALFYLRHELERHLDCRVEISQYTINDPYYDTLLRISGSEAEALFFSVYIWNALYINRLVRDLKHIRPEQPIILGGPQAPYLADLPAGCTVVHGEIEGVDASFFRDLAQGCLKSLYKGVPGKPFHSPYGPEDFTGPLKNRQIYYESSRGCPFFCSYCLSSVTRGVRHRDVDSVQEELKKILANQPLIIKFVDRTFNSDPERTLAIWRYLAGHQTTTRFHFEIAPDRFTEEMLHFLETVAPDRFQFEIGIQSCNRETLKAVNRNMDVEQALANISRLAAMDNIHLHVDLILGLPDETEENFRSSFNRVFATRPHYIQMGLLKVLPETAIRGMAAEFGMLFCEQPPYEILATRWLDHRTLSNLHAFGECVEAFYNNRYFRSIWDYLIRHEEDPFHFFTGLLKICRRHDFFNLAHTQQLMDRILFDFAAERPDSELLHELLRYDWLRCGHKFLPDYLETTSQRTLREELRHRLPQNLAGLFDHHNRTDFVKQAVFLRMSGTALSEIGFKNSDTNGYLCFLPEQTTGVIKLSRVELLSI